LAKGKGSRTFSGKYTTERGQKKLGEMVGCNNKLGQALSTEQTEIRGLARQLLLLKEGSMKIAEGNEDLQKDVQQLEEAKAQVVLQLQGAKDAIQSGVDDLNQLAYELRQTKSAHNLDSWRFGKWKLTMNS
jgi:hypothetical protein